MATSGGLDDHQKKLFLETLRETANVTAGAERAGIPRYQVYRMRKRDKAFREAWDNAIQAAVDDLEAALRRRALEGVEHPVFYGGKECGRVRTYNDALGMFILKGRRPEVFNARTRGAGKEAEASPIGNARELVMARLARFRRSQSANEDRKPTKIDRKDGE